MSVLLLEGLEDIMFKYLLGGILGNQMTSSPLLLLWTCLCDIVAANTLLFYLFQVCRMGCDQAAVCCCRADLYVHHPSFLLRNLDVAAAFRGIAEDLITKQSTATARGLHLTVIRRDGSVRLDHTYDTWGSAEEVSLNVTIVILNIEMCVRLFVIV